MVDKLPQSSHTPQHNPRTQPLVTPSVHIKYSRSSHDVAAIHPRVRVRVATWVHPRQITNTSTADITSGVLLAGSFIMELNGVGLHMDTRASIQDQEYV